MPKKPNGAKSEEREKATEGKAVVDMQWTTDLLFAKARRYMDRAREHQEDGELFPFWSSMAMEFLARAALAKVSPALLADCGGDSSKEGFNLLFALGVNPPDRFAPKSIQHTAVLLRCEWVVEGFTSDHRKFFDWLSGRRNEELHSGGMPFTTMPAGWLADLYSAAKVLLAFIERDLADLLDDEDAATAEELLVASADAAAKEVKGEINAYRTVWKKKSGKAQAAARENAEKDATPDRGHRRTCPACGSVGLLRGEAFRTQPPMIDESGEIIVRSSMRPVRFDCTACGLSIEGIARLHAAEMGGPYTRRSTHNPIEFYSDAIDEHIRQNYGHDEYEGEYCNE